MNIWKRYSMRVSKNWVKFNKMFTLSPWLLAQNSVEDANDATQALEQITTSINQISDMATQISSAAEEQRAVTDEVSRNIQAVKDVSDELAVDADSSRNLSAQLKNISGELNNQVGMFRI